MAVSRQRSIAAFAVLLGLSSSGCAVGPDFKEPAPPEVDRYTVAPLPRGTASTDVAFGSAQRFRAGAEVPAEWWKLFQSPGLDALMTEALRANPNLQAQLAALRSSKELIYAQQGKFFPLVQANFNPLRQQVPNNNIGATSQPTNTDNPFNVFTAQVTVAYTLDVWGLNRRQVESQQALADLQRFQTEAAYIALTGNLVIAVVQEAALRAQIDATRQMIGANTQALDILHRQQEMGAVNRNDVALQEAALAQVKATLPPLQKALDVQHDLVAALAGHFPSQLTEKFRLTSFRLPRDLPVSLPSQLIDQRPDVRAAEEQLHSAGALVGVAIANTLPNFTISGSRGYQALELANLISPPNLFWSVAGNAAQTVFDGFTLLHTARAAQGTYEQAAWNYRNAVVIAVQNVADSLQALENDAKALQAAREFERASKISLDLARAQLKAGSANVLLLLTAQTTYLQSLIQVILAETNRLQDTAALFVALGGGWWNRPGPPSVEQTFDAPTGVATPVAEH
jgi:NodT family efflux transporter outer membrane factor (OMF) lipoprotein